MNKLSPEFPAVKLETLSMETGLYQAAVQFVKNGESDMLLPGTDLTAALLIEEFRSRTDVVIDEPSGTVRTVLPISSDLLYPLRFTRIISQQRSICEELNVQN